MQIDYSSLHIFLMSTLHPYSYLCRSLRGYGCGLKSYWVWDSEAKKSLINHDMVVDEDHVENLPYIAMDSLRMDPYVKSIT